MSKGIESSDQPAWKLPLDPPEPKYRSQAFLAFSPIALVWVAVARYWQANLTSAVSGQSHAVYRIGRVTYRDCHYGGLERATRTAFVEAHVGCRNKDDVCGLKIRSFPVN